MLQTLLNAMSALRFCSQFVKKDSITVNVEGNKGKLYCLGKHHDSFRCKFEIQHLVCIFEVVIQRLFEWNHDITFTSSCYEFWIIIHSNFMLTILWVFTTLKIYYNVYSLLIRPVLKMNNDSLIFDKVGFFCTFLD